MPPVYGADDGQIEQSVIRYGSRQLLNSSAIVATDSHCQREEQLVVADLAVDLDGCPCGLRREVPFEETVEVEPLALVSLEFFR